MSLTSQLPLATIVLVAGNADSTFVNGLKQLVLANA
jgi:hypothetical protein